MKSVPLHPTSEQAPAEGLRGRGVPSSGRRGSCRSRESVPRKAFFSGKLGHGPPHQFAETQLARAHLVSEVLILTKIVRVEVASLLEPRLALSMSNAPGALQLRSS